MDRVCIFAHYDRDNLVDEYVYYYLKELKTVCQEIVFVTVSDILKVHEETLNSMGIKVIRRKNIGYDFYSYKVGIESIDLNEYDELIVCNDSVFGPIVSLEKVFMKMNKKKCDFWGITECSLEKRHLQSYFVVYKKKVFSAKVFKSFWEELKVIEDKNILIKQYEIGLTQLLYKNSFKFSALIVDDIPIREIYKSYVIAISEKRYKTLRKIKMLFTFRLFYRKLKKLYNPSTGLWEYLRIDRDMPFIKKSLFTTEENKNLHIYKLYKNSDKLLNDYPLSLIKNYMDRINL